MALMVLLISMGIACAVSIGSSAPPAVSPPPVPLADLLLDTQPFPDGWIAGPCLCRKATVEVLRDFYDPDRAGAVIQDVFFLGSEKAASTKFRTYREVEFRLSKQSPASEYVPPSEIPYQSTIADEYYLACGVDIVPVCKAIFRYDQYFVFFHFDIYEGRQYDEGMKMGEVEPILRAMDERAAALLYK